MQDFEDKNKPQVLILGVGMTFRDKSQATEYFKNLDIDFEYKSRFWHEWLSWSLEDFYEFIKFKKPVSDNADYDFWKIVFEKYFVKFNDQDLIIVAHSLGTIFILKYLLENGFVKKIKQLHLVSPFVANEFQPVDDVENTGSFTFNYQEVVGVAKYCEQIHIWHSTDDTMCLYKNAEYLKEKIPSASLYTFTDKGHFLQSTFWEIFDELRKIS